MLELVKELEDVKELLKTKKFSKLQEYLEKLNSADIPSFFEELSTEESIILYKLLSKEKAAEVFTELDSDIQEKLIEALTDKELKEVIDELFIDDTVDLIEEMPSNVVKRILKHIDKEERKVINEILNYPEDSAGSIMTTEFVDLKENMTIEECFKKIKKECMDKETLYTCYVLSLTRKIVGVVGLKDLLLAEKDKKVSEIMDTNVIIINTLEDQEEVSKKFDKYNKYALPVVDNESRLVGIITIDDAIDVMHKEAEEDFEKMAAVMPSEDSYFKTSVFTHTKNRIFWLLVLMLSSAVTGAVITKYENAFAAVPLLVSFIPMIMGTGGNCGSQTSTLVIRGLAVEEIKLKDWFKVLWKELRVALVVGILLFLANSIKIYAQYQDLKLCITLGITLIATIIVSKSIGCLLPILAKKLKQDPAIMAAPLITTVVDLCSIMLYFSIATMIMGI